MFWHEDSMVPYLPRLLATVVMFGAVLTAAADAQERRTQLAAPAISRGGDYMGFPEKFNRYYTDAGWRPSRIVHVSAHGGGDGATPDRPASVQAAIASARPGTLIHFARGRYQGCFNFTKDNGGDYDQPVVLLAERNPDQSPGVVMTCCNSGRQACFNFENADYVAVDGFELIGGRYGVRAVGADYAASQHSRGIAVLNTIGHDQTHDPFFTGAADWAVFERNLAYGAQKGDGHGIYLSNGGDWNIVRFNETHSNANTGLQINADPLSTCKEVGIAYSDPRCHAYAGTGEGGHGASDYFLIDSNYFHRSDIGVNFTSLRRSIVRNNIFGPATRHNVSFWQETDEPRLGSSDNAIVHNLFITTGRHGVQFVNHSRRNEFANNVLIGVRMNGGVFAPNPSALLMEVDATVRDNDYRANLYISGRMDGRVPTAQEAARSDFSPGWYASFPMGVGQDPQAFRPTPTAPFIRMGPQSPYAPVDRNGVPRPERVDLGPIQLQ